MKPGLPEGKTKLWIGIGIWIILIGSLEIFVFLKYSSSLASIGFTSYIFGAITGFTLVSGSVVLVLGFKTRTKGKQ